ncbi:MAG: glutamate ligase domain-containing protein [Flavonifractor plautii]
MRVEHRIELVRTRNGVRYYNDSIASSPSRTIAGLRSFHQKVVLIAGGYDKHIPFDVLGPEVVEHVKALVLTGDTAPKLRQAVERAPVTIRRPCPLWNTRILRRRCWPPAGWPSRGRGAPVARLRLLRPLQEFYGAGRSF